MTATVVDGPYCDDNGTPANPNDDVYFFDIEIIGNATGSNWEVLDANVQGPSQGDYGQTATFGPYNPGTNVLINFVDADDPSCMVSVTETMPDEACSDQCAIRIDDPTAICFDNDTPFDGSDDQFFIVAQINGSNTSSNWVGTGGAQGTYGDFASFGPFPISQGAASVSVFDQADPSCSASVSMQAPQPCIGCDIEVQVLDTLCQDNGTPFDPSDDTFTATVIVTAQGAFSSAWRWQEVPMGAISSPQPYGQEVVVGPFPISGGEVDLRFWDVEDANCREAVVIGAPDTCSDEEPCSITASADAACNDGGTPTDPSDDFYTITVSATAQNGSDNFIVLVNGVSQGSFPYNGGGSFTLPADGSTVTLEFQDADDSSCSESVTLNDPLTPCSDADPCDLSVSVSDPICDDNGTPGDESDDTFTFDVVVNNAGIGTSWVANDGTSGQYGETVTFGPYDGSDIGAAVNFTITDVDDPNCQASFQVLTPNCTNDCNLTADIVGLDCQDQGTSDPSDDTYTFGLVIHGNFVGDTWTADDGTTGMFGDTISFGPYLIADGNVTFDVTPDANDNCVLTVLVTAPEPCSPIDCDIAADVYDIECDDNGTPTDNSDDTFSFTVNVTGSTGSNNWLARDESGMVIGFGSYGIPSTFTGNLISDGDMTITFVDVDNADCSVSSTVEAPQPCSNVCDILATVVESECDINDTPNDPSDDTYTFELTVTGSNVGDNWTTDINGNPVSGQFDTTYVIGPIAGDTDLTLVISNEGAADCSTTVNVEAPDCPDFVDCPITAQAFNIVCDDNGTPDISDDVFLFDLLVLDTSGTQTGTGQWEIVFGSNSFTGFYGIPAPGQEIPAADVQNGSAVFEIRDAQNPDCNFFLTVEFPVAPEIDCPEDTDVASVAQQVQFLNGQLDSEDLVLDSLCWADGLAAGERYADTLTVIPESGDVYTFVLLSNMGQNEGWGAIYEGAYDSLMPCCNLIDTTHAPQWAGTYEFELPMLDFSAFNFGGTPVGSMSVELAAGQSYNLMVTSQQAGITGNYRWAVFSQDGGQLLGPDSTAYFSQEEEVLYKLLCDDTDELLNNMLSLPLTGNAEISNFCGIDSVFFVDQLLAGGDCEADTILRDFVVLDLAQNSFSCQQEITIAVPQPEDVKMPRLNATFDCEDNFAVDANGYPSPQVTGYPYVQTAFGWYTLDEPYCNLSASYEDSVVEAPCASNYTLHRRWTISDDCDEGAARTFIQTIKVGDLEGPVVSCATTNHYCPILEGDIMLFPTDPFDCTATIDVPMPEVEDACSEEWEILTEVLAVDVSDGSFTVIDTLLDGELPLITGLEIGEYKFRYTVTDECGNSTQQLCHFRVADTSDPVAICVGSLNVSVGGFGLARLYTQHIDAGSYDNCGIDSIMVRRVYERDPDDCSDLNTPFYSQWGPYVEMNCCDAGTYVTVELRVVDIYGNENKCWLDVLVEDKTLPDCYGLEDIAVGCGELPADFDPFNLAQLDSLFGEIHVVDNCSADAISLDPEVDLTGCGNGTITRRFLAVDRVGNISQDTFEQVITIGGSGGFDVRFPADLHLSPQAFEQADSLQGVAIYNGGCDSLSASFTDSLVTGGDEVACNRILRTWEVTNWCVFDSTSATTALSRDENCDGEEGEAALWLLGRADSIYTDADSLAANFFPAAGTKATACDGNTNPEGYWRTVGNTGRWTYTQVIYLKDEGFNAYAVQFPKDSSVYCHELTADTASVLASVCDSVTVSHTDSLAAAEGEECYRLLRTWTVTNWDEYDGLSDAVVVSRDENCNGIMGEEDVWVLQALDSVFVDADSSAQNLFPAAGVKDTLCDGSTNPEGYWRTLSSTGRWMYTQVLYVYDTLEPAIVFTEPEPFCSFDSDSCDANVAYPFSLDGKCLPDSLLADSAVEMNFRVFLDAGADGTLDGDITDSVTIAGQYPDYELRGKFPQGTHALRLEAADACGNMATDSLPFQVIDCFVQAPDCYDNLVVELSYLETEIDIDGDGELDMVAAEIPIDYLLESLDATDCNGPVSYSLNMLGDTITTDKDLIYLTCADGDEVEVETWSWDEAYNPYAAQPDGTVGGRNNNRCLTTIRVINSVACDYSGLRSADTAKPTAEAAPALYQNYPNPFAAETVIPFWLPEGSEVQLSVRDVTGKIVKLQRGWYDAGRHEWQLDRQDMPATGLYFYSLQADGVLLTKQLLITE
ncbi:MAG: T9SS type A sorting domain-containing protein [Bacteroidetes bacterium]|nr:T9SS type A sorting domain-containing protein [Bacteroidota bacterium]